MELYAGRAGGDARRWSGDATEGRAGGDGVGLRYGRGILVGELSVDGPSNGGGGADGGRVAST